jgi:chaperonin GroES
MLEVEPVGDQVFVLPDACQEIVSDGGIVIPFLGFITDPCNPHVPCTGTAVAVGPGGVTPKGVFVRPEVKPGDRILFSRFAGMNKGISINGQWYRVMHESEIQAVIEGGRGDRGDASAAKSRWPATATGSEPGI